MKPLLKFAIATLVTLELVLLTTLAIAPAKATLSLPEIYTWNFEAVGSNQLVCKKVVVAPEDREVPPSFPRQAVNIRSVIVDNSYCAHTAKPLVENRESSQG